MRSIIKYVDILRFPSLYLYVYTFLLQECQTLYKKFFRNFTMSLNLTMSLLSTIYLDIVLSVMIPVIILNRCMYMYKWITFLYTWNFHNIVNQLYSNMGRLPWWLRPVKNLPEMWEIWVRSPVWEDPLEKEMTTHSSTLAWKIPWMNKHGRNTVMGSQRVAPTSLHNPIWI